MKLKLNNDELLSFRDTVSYMVNNYRDNIRELNMQEKLTLSLFEEMLMNISQKSLVRKEKYSMNLKPSWALAFQIAISGQMPLDSYEGRTMQRICDQIHQTFS